MFKKCAVLFLLCLASCDYVDDIADNAAENAIGDCPTQTQIEASIRMEIDDAFEVYRSELKNDMKEVLAEAINEYTQQQRGDYETR